MATLSEPLISVVGESYEDNPHRNASVLQTNNADSGNDSEGASFLNKATNDIGNAHNVNWCVCLRLKLQKTVCLKSGSVVVILTWVFLASMLHWFFLDPSSVITPFTLQGLVGDKYYFISIIAGVYIYYACLQLFYPLSGYLADVGYGRYKCVITSLWCFVGSSLAMGILGAGAGCSPLSLSENPRAFYPILSVSLLFLAPPLIISVLIFFSSIVAFNANVIQFGLDQLHDRPTEHLVLFIHWYVILSYTGTELIRALASTLISLCFFSYWNLYDNLWVIVLSLPLAMIVIAYFVLFISLCIAFRKRHTWFLSNNRLRNPYALVYRIISFAKSHKFPIRRSAFTYCEDDLPSRLDLGKEKYGGPFTTEQVEDVKVFVGIIKVMLSLGPLFVVERSINFLLPAFSSHISHTFYPCSFISNDIFPSIIIVCALVLYTVLIRPHVLHYIPGMLKRIGVGMILMIVPTLCFLILDTVGHNINNSNNSSVYDGGCFLNGQSYLTVGIQPYYLFIPLFSSISGSMIFYIAVYEFIYSQSPHSMKGLMIGTFFAIRGLFQLIGALVIMFPFAGWNLSSSFPSCGFVYYLVNSIVALLGIVVYMWVARKYQPRQRDEPDNVYRYAEEYYAKAQDESNYDSDSYSNLNVHTIG